MSIRPRRTKRHGTVYDVIVYQHGTQRWKRGFRTRGEARTYEAHCRLGHPAPSARLTTGDVLTMWLGEVIEGQRAYNTERSYTLKIQCAIRALGDVPVRLLTPQRCHAYLRALPVQRSSAHAYGMAFRAALRWAARRNLITENPMEQVPLPRFERPERRVLDDEQMRLFLAASRRSRFYPAYCLALGCGLCIGECLDLEWRDVDLTLGRVTVRHGKTRHRRRMLALPEFTRQALLDISPRVHDEPVIPRSAVRTVQKHIYSDLRHYTPLTFHELRHSHATALLLAGEPLKVVSERLGHSSVRITADVYQHCLLGMDERAAKRMDDLIEGRLREAQSRA